MGLGRRDNTTHVLRSVRNIRPIVKHLDTLLQGYGMGFLSSCCAKYITAGTISSPLGMIYRMGWEGEEAQDVTHIGDISIETYLAWWKDKSILPSVTQLNGVASWSVAFV